MTDGGAGGEIVAHTSGKVFGEVYTGGGVSYAPGAVTLDFAQDGRITAHEVYEPVASIRVGSVVA